jgi:Type II secretion system (T2SS), protein M subtype b
MNWGDWIRSAWLVPALVLAALGLAAASYWPALAVINDREERLAAAKETLTRLDSQIAVGQSVIDAAAKGGSPLAGDFLSGANESLVVAGLQSRLREMAIRNNVELNSSNSLPSRVEDEVTYLGLHVVMRGEIKDVQHVLHGIETGRPILFVSRAGLRMDTWPIQSSDPERNGQPALVAELDVFGAMLPDGAEAPPPVAGDRTSPGSANAAPRTAPRGRR